MERTTRCNLPKHWRTQLRSRLQRFVDKVKGAFVAVSVVSLLLPNAALPWNLRGHMMVAAIAWEQMKPETKARATFCAIASANLRFSL